MKYNKINKEIEKDLDGVLDFIVNNLNINILINFRSRLYPEYRCLLNNIAFRKHKVSPSEMAKFYNKRGLRYSHDKYMKSIGKFDSYAYDFPELKHYLNMFFKESTPIDKEVVVIDKTDLTPIQKLVSDLTIEESRELSEMIELRKKSWLWKSKNNYEVINSY
tara:strand:+ start:135 stop:623 length:489 start_codon:yes stop_codon:yes gene_type:complete